MTLFRGIQEYIALDANNITLVFDSGNIVNISGNIFLYPPQGHPILYKCYVWGMLLRGCVRHELKNKGSHYFTHRQQARDYPQCHKSCEVPPRNNGHQ